MPRPDERLLEFAVALLDPARPMPPGLVDPEGEPSAKRFAVYRNNVIAGLVGTLEAAFPAVRRLVGGEFFAAMARIYSAREPPRSPIMLHYGAGFPDFIGEFEPAAGLPYLRDVARLERAWLEAYHAPEAAPLEATAFATMAADQLPYINLELHPSRRIVRSPWPIVTIWTMNVSGETPAPIDINSGAESALLIRPGAEVEVRALSIGAAAFVAALTAGVPVVGAMGSALLADPLFDLGHALAGLIEARALVGWHLADAPPGMAA